MKLTHPITRRSLRSPTSSRMILDAAGALRSGPGVMETTVGYCGGNNRTPPTGLSKIIRRQSESSITLRPSRMRNCCGSSGKCTPYPGARTQYRSAVWIHSEAQKGAVEAVREELSGGKKEAEASWWVWIGWWSMRAHGGRG